MTDFRLLTKFESTFTDGPYKHRNSQLGNRIADYLFDDLYELDPSSKLRADVDAERCVLNPKGISPGLRARRGDGSFGPIVPGHKARVFTGHVIRTAQTAEVDIGSEVKILAKSMIKQLDRVESDLCGQARHFKTKSPDAITVGLVGINVANYYVSYEGDRSYPTGVKDHPHPAEEAPEAERRLTTAVEPCYDEFLVLAFRATNVSPYPFEWVNRTRTADGYAAALRRILRAYARRTS